MSKKNIWESCRELVHYSAVGITLTFVNWMLYAVSVRMVSMTAANIFSWAVTVVLAYLGNKLFVFESDDWEIRTVMREFISYLGARGATGLIEIGALPVLYQMGMQQQIFGVKGMGAKIAVSLLVMVLNYLCSRFLVFRQPEMDKRSEATFNM